MISHDLEVLNKSKQGMKPSYSRMIFVKVTHKESGITVTKRGKTTIEARGLALIELENLVADWLIFS